MIDWCDNAEETWAGRLVLKKFKDERDVLFSLVTFMFGLSPSDPPEYLGSLLV